MRKLLLGLAATLTLAVASGALTAPAAAQSRREPGPRYVYVTAESRYSGASITAPVRVGARNRLEVRLPGGTWIHCEQSCSDTLRRETVDFWQNHGGRPREGRDGPGYLHFKF